MVVLEFGLRNYTGHHYNSTLSVLRAARAEGWTVRVLAGDTFPPETQNPEIVPFFEADLYAGRSTSPGTQDFESWLLNNSKLGGDLAGIPDEWIRGADIVLFPALTQYHCWSVVQWIISRLSENCRGVFVIQLMFSPTWTSWDEVCDAGPQMYSEALQELRGWIGKRVFLVSEFESSAREYQGLLGESVSILPHPALPPETPISRGTERDESPVVGLLGYSKREKGFHLLPSIISAVWARREFEQTRFLVQVNHGGYDTAVAEAEAWLRNVAGPKLRLLEGPQSTEAYHAALAEVDVVLLPYDPELYRGRGSGVFSEAVSFAKPIVAPEQSGLGEELAKERAAGVTFAHHEGGAIAASVLAVLERRGDFHSTAVRAAVGWRATNSGANFIRILASLAAE